MSDKLRGGTTIGGYLAWHSGNLVSGAITTPTVVLNSEVTGTPTEDSGVEIERGDSANVSLLWNETDDVWQLTNDGTNYYDIITSNTKTVYLGGTNLTLSGDTFNVDDAFLKNNADDTTSGNLTIGATTKAANSIVNILSADGYEAIINLHGSDQGTGRLFVGQSLSHGGGIYYNGDSNPAYANNTLSDSITLYRVNGSVPDWTARNLYSSNDWEFRGNITAPTFVGALTGNATTATSTPTATWADTVDVNGSNTSTTYYDIVWHSGDTLYSGVKLEAQASTGNIRSAGQLISTVAIGTAPLVVTSTTKVTNLNADSVDGFSAVIDSYTGNQLGVRNASGDIHARLFRSNYATQTSLNADDDLCFRVSTTDNYMRFIDRAGIISWLEDGGLNSGDYLPLSGGTITGDLTIEGTLYETSALKYKENVKPLVSSLDKVCKLQGVSYSKKVTPNKQEIGLIADDVYKVVPEIVKVKDGEIEGLEYSRIVALLVESVKELKQEIEKLKNINNI